MAAKILNVLFNAIVAIANVFLTPINLILVNFVPDFTESINTFTTSVTLFVTEKVAWFSYMIPPATKKLLFIYLLFVINYYIISYSVHGILWVLKVVKKLPFT